MAFNNCPDDAQIRDAGLRAIARATAARNGWDPNLVEAIIMVESNGDQARLNKAGSPTPLIVSDGRQYSHGVMQVGLDAAHDAQEIIGGEFPFTTYPGTNGRQYAPELAEDSNSVLYGVNYLSALAKKYPKETENGSNWVVLANMYNGGPGARFGKLPRPYTSEVNNYYHCLSGRDLEGWPENLPSPLIPMSLNPPPPMLSFIPICKDQPLVGPPLPPVAKLLPPNPNFPYCYVRIGGFSFATGAKSSEGLFGSVKAVTERPQYITEFRMVEKLLGPTEVIIRVFDPHWDIGGAAIRDTWRADMWMDGKVEFGYIGEGGGWGDYTGRSQTEDEWSEMHSGFFVSGYNPEFFGWGVETTIHLLSLEAARDLDARTEVHTEPISTGRDDEPNWGIVEKLATRMGFGWCTLPTNDMQEVGAGTDSAAPKPKTWSQGGIGNMAFMIQKLAPYAVAKGATNPKNGNPIQAQYHCWYTTENNILHFHPPTSADAPVMRTYTYTRARNGAIISFQPIIDEFRAALLAGVHARVSGTDDETLEPMESEESTATSPVIPSTPRRPPNPAGRQFTSAMRTKEQLSVEAVNDQQHSQAMAAQFANLTIVGDPKIRPGWKIRVVVLNWVEDSSGIHKTVEHWMTDTWQVREATHIIRGGQYLTSLHLWRIGLAAAAGEGSVDEATPAVGFQALDFDPAAGIVANFPNNLLTVP